MEWQAPSFQTTGQRAFLVLLAVSILSLLRRPRWRAALPMVVFTIAGLLAARNIAVASIVLVAGGAPSWAGIGSITGSQRGRHGALIVGSSEEHTSELQSLMRISYAVFCLKKKK